MRRRVRRLQGVRQPPSPRGDSGLVCVRRARDLVDRGCSKRGRRARSPAVLRGRARHRDEGQRGRDPVNGPAHQQQEGGVMQPISTIAEVGISTLSDSRELASRENDGLNVILLWHPRADAVTVSVEDSRTGQYFELAVERKRALDAFYHPFAYAA